MHKAKAKQLIGAAAALLGILVVDQVTKSLMPTLHTTSRVPVSGMVTAMVVAFLIGRMQKSFTAMLLVAVFIGSAAGNVFDMVVYGSVRDVFAVQSVVFNIADVGIVTSLVIFVLAILRKK